MSITTNSFVLSFDSTGFRPKPLVITSIRDELPDYYRLSHFAREGGENILCECNDHMDDVLKDRPDIIASWIRFLRDATACGIFVEWDYYNQLENLIRHIVHVAPPRAYATDNVIWWRKKQRFGMLYCRFGPGFITIVDRRNDSKGAHLTLNQKEYIDIFMASENVVRREELLKINETATQDLERENLLVSENGWTVRLPIRLTHFPVPFSAI